MYAHTSTDCTQRTHIGCLNSTVYWEGSVGGPAIGPFLLRRSYRTSGDGGLHASRFISNISNTSGTSGIYII